MADIEKLIFLKPILSVCGATSAVLPYAVTYAGITDWGIPFVLFTQANTNLIRADGSPTWAMISSMTGAVINVGLDALFMLVFKWEMAGAAAAAVVGRIISAGMTLGYFLRFKAFKITPSMLKISLNFTSGIVKLGTAGFLNLFIYGAKNYLRVRETYLKAVKVIIAISVAFFLAFQIFPDQLVSIFGSGERDLYLAFARQYMRIYLLMLFIVGIQQITANFFTATGRAGKGIFLSLARQGLFLLPLLIILPLAFGLSGVIYAGPVADFLAITVSLSMIAPELRRLKKTGGGMESMSTKYFHLTKRRAGILPARSPMLNRLRQSSTRTEGLSGWERKHGQHCFQSATAQARVDIIMSMYKYT